MTVKRFPGYVYSRAQNVGVVAAHNHLTLVNPAGSDLLVILGGVFISQTTIGAVSGAPPMRGHFCSDVSGGTAVNVADIGKTKSTLDDPVAEVRVNGVTVSTLGAAWFNSPSLETTGASSPAFVHQIPTALPGSDAITLFPGEGTVFRTEAGDTDQRWNMSVGWVEVRR